MAFLARHSGLLVHVIQVGAGQIGIHVGLHDVAAGTELGVRIGKMLDVRTRAI
jgi:hypothetical protein